MSRFLSAMTAAGALMLGACADRPVVAPHGQQSEVGTAVLSIVSGDNQIGGASTRLGANLKILVQDNGVPVADARGSIAVTAGGGTVSKARFRTGATGEAAFSWTLGESGAQTVTVTLNRGNAVVFTASVVPGGSTLAILSGNAQTAAVGDSTPNVLVAVLQDSAGVPIEGVSVRWSILDGGGALRKAVNTTNGIGRSINRLQLGPAPGVNRVRATVPGVATVIFDAIGTLPGAVMIATAGDNQLAPVTDSLPGLFRIEARDGSGVPLAGATVDWMIAEGTGALRRAQTLTNASGIAANRLLPGPGENVVTAQIAGVGSVSFQATGYSANGVTIVSVSPDTFNTSIGETVVTVTALAAATAGVTSPIYVSTGGLGNCVIPAPSGAPATATGSCSFTVARYGATAGTYGVTASAGSLTPATHSLVVRTQVPTTLRFSNITPDTFNTSLDSTKLTFRVTANSLAGLTGHIFVSTGVGSCTIPIPAGYPSTHTGNCSFTVARYGASAGTYGVSASVGAGGGNSASTNAQVVVQTHVPTTVTLNSISPSTFNSSLGETPVTISVTANSLAGLTGHIFISTGVGSCTIPIPAGYPSTHTGNCSFTVARYGASAGTYGVSASVGAGGGNSASTNGEIVVQTYVPTTITLNSISPSTFNSSLGETPVTISVTANSLAGLTGHIFISTGVGSCTIPIPAGYPSTHTGNCSFTVARYGASAGTYGVSASVGAGGGNSASTNGEIVVQTYVPTSISASFSPNVLRAGQYATITAFGSASSAAGLTGHMFVSTGLGSCTISIPAGYPSSHSGSCSFTVPTVPGPGTYGTSISVSAGGGNSAASNSSILVNP